MTRKTIIIFAAACAFAFALPLCASARTVVTMGGGSDAPLSPAVISGEHIYVSGQIPMDKDGTIPEGIEKQTRLVLDNIARVVKEAGGDMGKTVKTTVFITDFDDFAAMNKVYRDFFKENFPARSTVEVSKLAFDVLVEIDAIVEK